jgi:hypothetical protein
LAARFRIVGLVRDADSLPKGIDDVLERARAIMVPVFSDLSIERMVIDSHPQVSCLSPQGFHWSSERDRDQATMTAHRCF